jgi:RNA 2',3'-cyclic 3'-phosphodiesterase
VPPIHRDRVAERSELTPVAKPSGTTRLFLALWPDALALRALAAWQARWAWPAGAAVVPPERLHLTLHYIGPVPTARLAEVTHGLQVPMQRFDLEFDRAELWPRGLAVLCASAPPDALITLHDRLQAALQRLRLPTESRPYRPHVTLARKAAGASPPDGPLPARWSMRGYALVQSAGDYRVLQHYR